MSESPTRATDEQRARVRWLMRDITDQRDFTRFGSSEAMVHAALAAVLRDSEALAARDGEGER